MLVGALGHQVGFVAIAALHLTEAIGGVANAARQDLLAQHRIDHRALAVGGASEEGHLHVIPLQHRPNASHLIDIALEEIPLRLVHNFRLVVYL